MEAGVSELVKRERMIWDKISGNVGSNVLDRSKALGTEKGHWA